MELMSQRNHTRYGGPAQGGFSLLEVLLAGVLLLVVALGVIPLIVRSSVSNVTGDQYSKASNYARSRTEELLQLPFDCCPEPVIPTLDIEDGQTERVLEEHYSKNLKSWQPGDTPADASDQVLWRRVTTIRQYNNEAFEDGLLEISEALNGDADPEDVHIKEIEVATQSMLETGALGPPGRVTVRVLKSQ
jgi:type II secretory pathway pseudopilin PulG